MRHNWLHVSDEDVGYPKKSTTTRTTTTTTTSKARSCFQELQNPRNQEVQWEPSDGTSLGNISTKCPSLSWTHEVVLANDNNSACSVSPFDPMEFVSIFRGRTLLFAGDSLSSMSCKHLQDVLRDSGNAVNTSGSSYGGSDPFRLRMAFGCEEFSNGILICCGWLAFSNARNERKIANQDLFTTNNSIAVNVLQPCDLMIWNSGVHHTRVFGGSPEDLIPLINNTLTSWNNMKDKSPVPSIWWKESYAQHFRSGHWMSRKEKVCKDIAQMPGENETGIFNNVTEPRILDFNIPIFRVYRASVPLYFAHYTVGDCTHFCNGDKGPMDHDNALLLALLKNAIEGNLLPPLPDERNSSSGYSIEKRWEMLMEHPTDSLMAKLDVCAPMHDSSKHHNWEVDKHGPIPEVLEECLRRSEAIHSSR